MQCNGDNCFIRNAQWDAYDRDVSCFVGSFITDIVNECLVKIELSPTSYFLFFLFNST